MSQILFATIGLPASGKTSTGLEMMKSDKNLRLVSKDSIRTLLYGNTKWTASREPLVVYTEENIIKDLLSQGYNIYCHNTHLAPGHIERLENIAKQYNSDFSLIDFRSVLIEDCIRRDALREDSVSWRVILGMAQRYLPDQYNTFRARFPTTNDVLEMLYIQRHLEIDKDKKDCIIVDIDGTLAIMDDRSPYDLTQVGKDKLYKPLAEILRTLSVMYTIIYLSGRESVCFNETKQWLEDNGLWHYDSTLIMREAGDNRTDSIVKEELWREHVDVFYNTIAVFDDRDQVVAMWRKLGLFCCQVNYGNF